MKTILIPLVAFTLVFSACSENTSSPANKPSANEDAAESKAAATASGQELFSSKCVVCHGADGTAGMGGAANLQTSTLDSVAVKQKIENGGASMPAFKSSLNTEEVARLGEYVKSLRK